MEHFFFWYFILTLTIGIASLTITAVVYFSTRGKLLRSYFYFLSALSLLVVLGSLLAYVRSNVPDPDTALFEILDYLESPLAVYCVMFMAPVFVHELFDVPRAKAKNAIFGCFIGIAYVGYNLFAYVIPAESFASSIVEYFEGHPVFIAVLLYSFVTGMMHYRRLEDEDAKRLGKLYLVLFGFFMPSIIQDKIGLTSARVFPVFYICLSVLFTYRILKREFDVFIQETKERPQSPSLRGEIPTEAVFLRYDISPREKEVVLLALQGCSYTKISERVCISVNTVKAHIRNIYPKFGVNSRYELLALLQCTPEEREE